MAVLETSFSRLAEYRACPLRYRYREVEGRPEPAVDPDWSRAPIRLATHDVMGFDLAFGRAVHAGLFRWQRALDGGAIPDPATLATEVRRAAAAEHLVGDELERALARELPRLTSYADGPWPRLRSTWLEHPVHLDVREGDLEMRVAMRVDRAVVDQGRLCILDYKTVPPHRAQMDQDAWQLRVYALAARGAGLDAAPGSIRLLIVDVRRGRILEVPAGEARLEAARGELLRWGRAIAAGSFSLGNAHRSRPCWRCGFRLECPRSLAPLSHAVSGPGLGAG